MVFYPVHKALQEISKDMQKGNFSLWYNKFVPLKNPDSCKPANDKGEETAPVEYYFSMYGKMKKNSEHVLKQKHFDLHKFCDMFPADTYETVYISATLKTPLITGIGESHPHEVSMVFDRNMGIPYIPASGVKGIVRFAHTLMQIPEADKHGVIKDGSFDDEEKWTSVPILFGTQERQGRVIFLDAYPEEVPDLHVDIMNPHYGDYYSDDKGTIPPADYLSPNPIKFLTVAAKAVFVFRAVAEKTNDLPRKVRDAFLKALTQEGVGAKTAIGYGRFEITEAKEIPHNITHESLKSQERSPLEKWCNAVKVIKATDAGKIGSTIDNALKHLASEEDKSKFAQVVKEHMGKDFKKSKARTKLEKFLNE